MRYSDAFRRDVLSQIRQGRRVVDVARQAGVSSQTVYNWRRQDLVDRGMLGGLTSGKRAAIRRLRCRIGILEWELARLYALEQQLLGGDSNAGAPVDRTGPA